MIDISVATTWHEAALTHIKAGKAGTMITIFFFLLRGNLAGTQMVRSPGGALIYISQGERIVPDREHVPGFPISQVPKFPSEAEGASLKTQKGFWSRAELIKSNGDNAMI